MSDPSLGTSQCPACLEHVEKNLLEKHFDRIGEKDYEVLACPRCEVVYSEPQLAVGSEWYEKAAPIRGRETQPNPERDWRYQMFFSQDLLPGSVLDVGCGGGGFLLMAKEKGFQTAGFDYDARMIALAKMAGLVDVEATEFETFCKGRREREFQYITLFDVLEHTPKPDWFMGLLKPLLEEGGYMVVTLPNTWRPTFWGREEHDYPPHHFTRWNSETLSRFLKSQGFTIEEVYDTTLRVGFISANVFFFFFKKLLPGVKRALFGAEVASSGKTITEMMDKSPEKAPGWFVSRLHDKLVRQTLVNNAKTLFNILFFPIAVLLWIFFKIVNPHCGDCLFILAKKASSK